MRADPIIPAVKRTSPRTAVRRLALGRFISYTGTVASGTALSSPCMRRPAPPPGLPPR